MRIARRISSVLVAALAAAALSGAPAVAGDDLKRDKKQVDARVSALRAQLEETSQSLIDAQTRLELTRAQVASARQALATARAQEQAAQDRYDKAMADVAAAQAEEKRLADQIESIDIAQGELDRQIADVARQAYMTGGMSDVSVTLEAVEAGEDPAYAAAISEAVLRWQGLSADSLAERETQLRDLRAKATATRAEREAAQKRASTSLEELTSAAKEAKTKADALAAREKDQAAAQTQLVAEKRKESAELAAAEAESKKLAAALAERARQARIAEAKRKAELERQRKIRAAKIAEAKRKAAAAKKAADRRAAEKRAAQLAEQQREAEERERKRREAAAKAVLAWPVASYITSEFGMRLHPIFNQVYLHSGMDFGGGCGLPVRAAADGQLIAQGDAGGQGNRVMIDHGLLRGVSLVTTYSHLDSFTRGIGAVKRGDVVGYIGNTGTSTACHLHFETHVNGTPVNPRNWL